MAKRAKETVDYSKGKPHAHCGLCRHFEPPKSCALVAGTISPQMWCRLFAPKRQALLANGPKPFRPR